MKDEIYAGIVMTPARSTTIAIIASTLARSLKNHLKTIPPIKIPIKRMLKFAKIDDRLGNVR